jgi:hypothetical protein
MRESRIEFIRQQGFSLRDADDRLYSALMLQPRIISALVVLGALLQSAGLFAALSAVLWWSTLVPARNPFDAAYNRFVARPRGFRPLPAAPAPRRFAEGMAAAFALAIAAALLGGFTIAALALQCLFVASAAAVLFRDFCGPASLFNSLRPVADQGLPPIEKSARG